jgi:phage-related protein
MLKTIISMFKSKDIRNRILFTLAMLFIFRFGAAITVPGVDISTMTNAKSNSLFEMINSWYGDCCAKTEDKQHGESKEYSITDILTLKHADNRF